jgi:hypothetical protein
METMLINPRVDYFLVQPKNSQAMWFMGYLNDETKNEAFKLERRIGASAGHASKRKERPKRVVEVKSVIQIGLSGSIEPELVVYAILKNEHE